jgi:uncharacterized protein YecE (DUF72 family)
VGTIRIGVAGWDYADWRGPVYPRGVRGAERLAFIARFVDAIEINCTFYRPADPRIAERWVHRLPDDGRVRFTAKAHRSWTHEPDTELHAAVRATLEGLTPIAEAGRLGALLVQFPHGFRWGDRARERLRRLVVLAESWPIVVELRHSSWQAEEPLDWFRGLGAGWCVVDQPRVGTTTAGPEAHVVGPISYLRLHGRNAGAWFRPGAGRDARYDYLYSPAELDVLADVARRLGESAAEVYVVQNNHFKGQALANALQMKRRIEGRPQTAPAPLVDAFPAITADVVVLDGGLFGTHRRRVD